MTLVLGVDGGGTKTHALVVSETGDILGSGTSGPSNWEDVGLEAAGAALRSAVHEAFGQAEVGGPGIAASVFGLAGLDWEADRIRLSAVPDALDIGGPSEVLNDSFVALRAGTNDPWGVVVIAGSGSVAAGRNRAGEVFRTLGMGPLYGDFGSASDISEEGVRAVAEAYTGKGPSTALSEVMREASGASSIDKLLEDLGRGRLDGTVFAPLVVRTAEQGDVVARSILESAGRSLGENAALVIRKLGMEDEGFELVLSGGLFRAATRILRSAVEEVVRGVAPGARPVRLEAPPVVGAGLLALELAGLETNVDLHARIATAAVSAFHLETPP